MRTNPCVLLALGLLVLLLALISLLLLGHLLFFHLYLSTCSPGPLYLSRCSQAPPLSEQMLLGSPSTWASAPRLPST